MANVMLGKQFSSYFKTYWQDRNILSIKFSSQWPNSTWIIISSFRQSEDWRYCRCILTWCIVIPVADMHSKILDAPAPRSKFFHFHAIFGKIWQNRMSYVAPSTPPPRVGASSSGKFWIRHCIPSMHDTFRKNNIESMGVSVAIPGFPLKSFSIIKTIHSWNQTKCMSIKSMALSRTMAISYFKIAGK